VEIAVSTGFLILSVKDGPRGSILIYNVSIATGPYWQEGDLQLVNLVKGR